MLTSVLKVMANNSCRYSRIFAFDFGFFGLIALPYLWLEFFCALEISLSSFYLIRDEPMELEYH